MEYKNYGENYIQEYDELIFGWAVGRGAKNKLGYFVYGIPGRFCIQEQPFQGTTGLLYLHPLAGHQRENGAMGYWLLNIDAQTGEVAFLKPIIPRYVGIKGTGSGYWVEGRGVLVFLLGLVEIEVINSRKIFKIFQKINRIVSSFL